MVEKTTEDADTLTLLWELESVGLTPISFNNPIKAENETQVHSFILDSENNMLMRIGESWSFYGPLTKDAIIAISNRYHHIRLFASEVVATNHWGLQQLADLYRIFLFPKVGNGTKA